MRLGIGAPQGLWGQAWEATEPHSTSWGGGQHLMPCVIWVQKRTRSLFLRLPYDWFFQHAPQALTTQAPRPPSSEESELPGFVPQNLHF